MRGPAQKMRMPTIAERIARGEQPLPSIDKVLAATHVPWEPCRPAPNHTVKAPNRKTIGKTIARNTRKPAMRKPESTKSDDDNLIFIESRPRIKKEPLPPLTALPTSPHSYKYTPPQLKNMKGSGRIRLPAYSPGKKIWWRVGEILHPSAKEPKDTKTSLEILHGERIDEAKKHIRRWSSYS